MGGDGEGLGDAAAEEYRQQRARMATTSTWHMRRKQAAPTAHDVVACLACQEWRGALQACPPIEA